MAKYAEEAKVPGLAVGIVAGGELVWFRGWGVLYVATRDPVDVDTVFRIASMSKAFLSAVVLQLRDEGQLSLDAPVDTYLPELRGLKYASTDSPQITLRLLLSHAGGLPEDNAGADLRLPMTEAEFDQVLSAGLSFSTSPGTVFEYSNLGFMVATRVVSRGTGVPYQKYASRRLLQPLGMVSSTFDAREVPEEHRAHGYGRRGSDMPSMGLDKYQDDAFHQEPVLDDGAGAGAGGLWTSPRDYARWVAFLLSAWPRTGLPSVWGGEGREGGGQHSRRQGRRTSDGPVRQRPCRPGDGGLPQENSLRRRCRSLRACGGTFADIREAEVEDLIPPDLLVRELDRWLRSAEVAFTDSLRPGVAIVPQIEAWARQQSIELVLGWKVELAIRVKKLLLRQGSGAVPKATLERWKRLFEAFQRTQP